jgi:hypothetical protein
LRASFPGEDYNQNTVVFVFPSAQIHRGFWKLKRFFFICGGGQQRQEQRIIREEEEEEFFVFCCYIKDRIEERDDAWW